MGSLHDELAGLAARQLLEVHGERDANGLFDHIPIALPGGAIILWPCSISELSQRYVERDGKIVLREFCTLVGPTGDLPAGSSLPEGTSAVVLKYGTTAFRIDQETSKYGGPITTLGLVRVPAIRLGNLQAPPTS